MTDTKVNVAKKWRNSRQISSVRRSLDKAMRYREDEEYIKIARSVARNLLEICDQAKHTEEGHGK